MKDHWYQINALAGKRKAEILIYEQIGKNWWSDEGVGAKDFMQQLSALDVDDIDLRINSLGGSVFEGNAIYNGLRNHKAKVHVKIDGIAASIASVIAMAGDDIEIPENGMIMIHDPWTYAGGNASDMRAAADMLDKIKTGIIAAYRGKTGKDENEIGDLMSAETWMTAQEAVDMGFADRMTASVEVSNSYDKETIARFRNTPERLINAGISGSTSAIKELTTMAENTPAKPEITLELIRAEYPEIAKALKEEGAKAETQRIKDVRAQVIPGHELLIEELINDGVTDGPTAAMKVVAAENEARKVALKSFKDSAPPVIDQPANDEPSTLSDEDKIKAEWDKSKELQAEFAGSFDAFKAYKQDMPGVNVKNQQRGGK